MTTARSISFGWIVARAPRRISVAFCLVAGLIFTLPATVLTAQPGEVTARQTARLERSPRISLRPGLSPQDRMTVNLDLTNHLRALAVYAELTGRQLLPRTNPPIERLDELLGGQLSRWRFVKRAPAPEIGVSYHRDGSLTAAEVKEALEVYFQTNGVHLVPVGGKYLRVWLARPPGDAAKTLNANRPGLGSPANGQLLACLYAMSLIVALIPVWLLRLGRRRLTAQGVAVGLLSGGLLALASLSLPRLSPGRWPELDSFWTAHPLCRLLCEHPAIWAVPLATAAMAAVSGLLISRNQAEPTREVAVSFSPPCPSPPVEGKPMAAADEIQPLPASPNAEFRSPSPPGRGPG